MNDENYIDLIDNDTTYVCNNNAAGAENFVNDWVEGCEANSECIADTIQVLIDTIPDVEEGRVPSKEFSEAILKCLYEKIKEFSMDLLEADYSHADFHE